MDYNKLNKNLRNSNEDIRSELCDQLFECIGEFSRKTDSILSLKNALLLEDIKLINSSKSNDHLNSFYPLVFFILFSMVKNLVIAKNISFHIKKNDAIAFDNSSFGYLEQLKEIDLLFKLFPFEEVEFILKSKSELLIKYGEHRSLIAISLPSYFKRIRGKSYFKNKHLENMQYLFNLFRIDNFYKQKETALVKRYMLCLFSSILRCRKGYVNSTYDYNQLKIRGDDTPVIIDQELSGSTFIGTIIEVCDFQYKDVGRGSVDLFIMILDRLFVNFMDLINDEKMDNIVNNKCRCLFSKAPVISIKEMYDLDIDGVLSNDLIPKAKQDFIESELTIIRQLEEKAFALFREVFQFDGDLFLIKVKNFVILEDSKGKELERIQFL